MEVAPLALQCSSVVLAATDTAALFSPLTKAAPEPEDEPGLLQLWPQGVTDLRERERDR